MQLQDFHAASWRFEAQRKPVAIVDIPERTLPQFALKGQIVIECQDDLVGLDVLRCETLVKRRWLLTQTLKHGRNEKPDRTADIPTTSKVFRGRVLGQPSRSVRMDSMSPNPPYAS